MVRLWSHCDPVAKLFIYTYVSHHTGIQTSVQTDINFKIVYFSKFKLVIFQKLCREKKKTPHPKRCKKQSETDSTEIEPIEQSVCEPEMVS